MAYLNHTKVGQSVAKVMVYQFPTVRVSVAVSVATHPATKVEVEVQA